MLVAEQSVDRDPRELSGGVEQSHLQPGPVAVVPHGLERGAADDPVMVLDAAPGVVLNRLAPADDAAVDVDAGDFQFGPGVNAGALHLGADAVDEGHVQSETLYLCYFRGHCSILSVWAVDGRFS